MKIISSIEMRNRLLEKLKMTEFEKWLAATIPEDFLILTLENIGEKRTSTLAAMRDAFQAGMRIGQASCYDSHLHLKIETELQ